MLKEVRDPFKVKDHSTLQIHLGTRVHKLLRDKFATKGNAGSLAVCLVHRE